MKIKKLLFVLLAVLLVFSLFGCGKKEPVEDVEPQDTTEQLDENIKNDISGTYELSNEEIAKYYEYGYLDAKGTIMQSIQSLKSKAKACAEKLGLTYSDAQAFNLFAYGTAIEQTKETIRSATDFIYPSDGLQQFISWRQQYEASLNKSNSTSNSSTAQEPSQQPSNNNNTSGSGNQSQPSGGSTPPNNTGNGSSGTQTPPPGVDPDDWYESVNGSADDKQLPKPDYEIIG